jgi:hypothetical protein
MAAPEVDQYCIFVAESLEASGVARNRKGLREAIGRLKGGLHSLDLRKADDRWCYQAVSQCMGQIDLGPLGTSEENFRKHWEVDPQLSPEVRAGRMTVEEFERRMSDPAFASEMLNRQLDAQAEAQGRREVDVTNREKVSTEGLGGLLEKIQAHPAFLAMHEEPENADYTKDSRGRWRKQHDYWVDFKPGWRYEGLIGVHGGTLKEVWAQMQSAKQEGAELGALPGELKSQAAMVRQAIAQYQKKGLIPKGKWTVTADDRLSTTGYGTDTIDIQPVDIPGVRFFDRRNQYRETRLLPEPGRGGATQYKMRDWPLYSREWDDVWMKLRGLLGKSFQGTYRALPNESDTRRGIRPPVQPLVSVPPNDPEGVFVNHRNDLIQIINPGRGYQRGEGPQREREHALAVQEVRLIMAAFPANAREILYGYDMEGQPLDDRAWLDNLEGHLARARGAGLIMEFDPREHGWKQPFGVWWEKEFKNGAKGFILNGKSDVNTGDMSAPYQVNHAIMELFEMKKFQGALPEGSWSWAGFRREMLANHITWVVYDYKERARNPGGGRGRYDLLEGGYVDTLEEAVQKAGDAGGEPVLLSDLGAEPEDSEALAKRHLDAATWHASHARRYPEESPIAERFHTRAMKHLARYNQLANGSLGIENLHIYPVHQEVPGFESHPDDTLLVVTSRGAFGDVDLRSEILDSIRHLDTKGNRGGVIPFPDLRCELLARGFRERREVDAELLAMQSDFTVDLLAAQSPSTTPDRSAGIEMPGRGLLYYVVIRQEPEMEGLGDLADRVCTVPKVSGTMAAVPEPQFPATCGACGKSYSKKEFLALEFPRGGQWQTVAADPTDPVRPGRYYLLLRQCECTGTIPVECDQPVVP